MLPHDFDLTTAHLQALSSREAIVAFFAQLGYNTEARLKQTSAALGFPHALAHEVTHVERVADHENGDLQVYLLEMKHVTVALTQALARALRNRAGNFLLVLTADYERIDFVLMEWVRPEGPAQGIKPASAFLRPRTLTLERRNPSPVDVRVLRRFSYTESDVYYQLDKIRSAYGVAEWSEPFFNNRALFSDYYLNERLPQLPEWQADAAPAFRALSKLLAEAREKFAGRREAELRTQLYQPLFAALGWQAEAQKAAHDDDARADYVLSDASGVRVPCLTYVWDRYLDGPDETRDSETPRENPAQTVVGLLERDQAGGWAIVTNGKVWRLYSARAHSRATNYYEIDLEETLASPEADVAFRYFWLFFRADGQSTVGHGDARPAGTTVGAHPHARFLDFLLAESASFAKALGERLKDRVFGEVFPYFAEGFIKHDRAAAWTDDDLAVAFQATLTFLYRLLFVLYAEARDLLPVRETRGYWEVSLQRIKEEIAAKAGNLEDEVTDRLEKAYAAGETTLYDRLLQLFRVIDRGAADLNVPIYNGGLFQTDLSGVGDQSGLEAARFLQSHKIPDRYLAIGLDKMARDIDEKRGDLVFIDYKSLGVRHLGSIYEGLLEFRLRVAREKMAVVRGKKTDEVIPAREALARDAKIKATLPKGAVYLENDRHERKATGSYYTPDYIVKYIVQHTVGPVLDEKFEALRPRLRQTAKRFDETVKRKQTIEHTAPDRPALLNDLAADLLRDLFDVKVLDPAMGSGHFLVEAVDFITDRLLRFLYGFPFVNHFFEGQRSLILSELQKQGVTVDPARLTDVNLLKRHVLKRCIFGVDLNPMAVELAKVSLWLDCFTLGAPLSFLDHHLKWGNSLIGARVDEVRDAVEFKQGEQLSMFASSQFTGIMLATDLMRHVGELPDTTAEQVAASRAEFRRANDALAPYKRIMDVYVSRWFGNDLTPGPSPKRRGERVDPTIEFLRRDETKAWLNDPAKGIKKFDAAMKQVAETAQRAAEEKRFFHWELEFPEVFFGPAQGSTQAIGLKEDGGFDAVIGNPPYGIVFDESIKPWLDGNFTSFQRNNDLYAVFTELALRLPRGSGYSALIVPNTFILGPYFASLKRAALKLAFFHAILDFGFTLLFPDPNVFSAVFVTQRIAGKQALKTKLLQAEVEAEQQVKVLNEVLVDLHILGESAWKPIDVVAEKAANCSTRLGELCFVKDVGLNYWTIGREKQRGDSIGSRILYDGDRQHSADVPYLKGSDFGRYTEPESDRHFLRHDFKKLLDPEIDQFRFSPEYLNVPAKIVYRQTADTLMAALDTSGSLVDKTVHVVVSRESSQRMSLGYILSVLNSRLLAYIYDLEAQEDGRAFAQVKRFRVEALPIRRIDFTTPTKRRAELVTQAKALYGRQDQAGLLAFVEQRLAAQPEESDVVHDVLAHLAEQMIDLNKRKQAEMKRFLGWLEHALTPAPSPKSGRGEFSLDVLTGKSRLRNYLGDYQKGEGELAFEDVIDILHKNRTKIGISLSDARIMARLRTEYEKSLETLKPLKAQLAWTDGVIDQIVYRLYGLTAEEIRVVEGVNE
jgi:hypothetical protein